MWLGTMLTSETGEELTQMMLIKTLLAAVAAGTVLATNAFAQNINEPALRQDSATIPQEARRYRTKLSIYEQLFLSCFNKLKVGLCFGLTEEE